MFPHRGQPGVREGERRGDATVGTSEVVHKPSDAEVALRCLAARLRGLRGLSRPDGMFPHSRRPD